MKKRITAFMLAMLLAVQLAGYQSIPVSAASEESIKTEEAGETEGTTTAEAAAVSSAYVKQEMIQHYKNGTVIFDSVFGEPLTNEKGKGLLISGKGKNLTTGRITFVNTFQFDGNAIGRVSVDGLIEKGIKASIAFYLDDEETPFVTVPLKRQKKSNTWTTDGESTENVLEKEIKGEHKISMAIVTETTGKLSFLLRSVEFVESSLPVVYLNLDESIGTIAEMNNDSDHDTECYGDMTIQIPDGYQSEYTTEPQSTKTYELEYIRGRGNSTWSADKKPYKLKLTKKADLFGMGKNKHWILLANRYDNSLMRNKMTYWLGKELGMEYTPECVFVDVVMNGEYLGSYYLCEQVRVGTGRVDIDDLEENEETMNATDLPTITGGYLLSLSPYEDDKLEKLYFQTSRQNEFLIESPSFEDYQNDAQYNYIKDYVQKTEDAIYGSNFKDSNGTSYTEYMDIDSAVDYYWIQELSMNGDAFITSSTYLYKKRDGKLYWGPLWDFDFVAWGDYDYSDTPYCEGFTQTDQIWFAQLLKDPEFVQKLAARWSVIREKLNEICEDGGLLDQYQEQLKVSQYYDREKWGAYDFGYWGDDDKVDQVLTFTQEKERLKNWIQTRADWIDNNVNSLIPKECTVTFKVGSKVAYQEVVMSGDSLTGSPKTPTKKGYVFLGWYMENDEAEIRYTSNYYISDSVTFSAKWIKQSEYKPVKNIYFKYKENSVMDWEDSYYMPYTAMPSNGYALDLTWTCSNTEIATVDEYGTVTFKKPGTVTITVKTREGVKASYKLHILDSENDYYPDSPEKMSFNKTSLTLKKGAYTKLEPVCEPSQCDKSEIRWFSTESSVATVDSNGVVTAKKYGTTTIVAFDAMSGNLAKCKIKVTDTAKKGSVYTVSGLKYKVTETEKNAKTVSCVGVSKKEIETAKIPATVKIYDSTYKVISIGKSAFSGSALKSVTIGSNVKTIGESAFLNSKNLSSITISSTQLTSIGKDAIKGIKKTAVISTPLKKKTTYQKYFTSKTGFLSKTMKIK